MPGPIKHLRTWAFVLIVLFVVSIMALPSVAQAPTIYYVDATLGNDGNPGTEAEPWKTINKVNITALNPGDTVLLKRGESWAERLKIEYSGTDGLPIIFGAYGVGDRPILSPGADWVAVTDRGAAVPIAWWVVENLEVVGTTLHGFSIITSSNFVIRNCDIHENGVGVNYSWGLDIHNCTNGQIYNNAVYSHTATGSNGMWMTHITNFDIHHNLVHSNRLNGIGMSKNAAGQGSNGNRIHHNLLYNNSIQPGYGAIGIETFCENNEVYNNLLYRNGHAGYLTNSPNNEIYHNTFYMNVHYQIALLDWSGSAPENNVFKNNILVIPDGDEAILFADNGTAGVWDPLSNTFDHNLHWYLGENGEGRGDWIAGGGGFPDYSWAEWLAEGKEANGEGIVDPKFVDPDNDDFHLTVSSPGIDAGTDVGITDDYDGKHRPMGSAPDMGAYEYGGRAPALDRSASSGRTPASPRSVAVSRDAV